MNQPALRPFTFPQTKTPDLRTYWVIDHLLLAGAYAGHYEPGAHQQRLAKISSTGIQTVINLMEPDERDHSGRPFVPYERDLQMIGHRTGRNVQCLRYPIVDRNIPSTERMNEIVEAIDRSISLNKPVYLHCFGGIDRTGMVVCCWLLKNGYATTDNVFETLARLRSKDTQRAHLDDPENKQQVQFVLDWAKQIPDASASPHKAGKPKQSNWFTKLTGIDELSPEYVRTNLRLTNGILTSLANGQSWQAGSLKIPTLHELREISYEPSNTSVQLRVREIIADAKQLHADVQNAGAVFQVASQFNLLEMISPEVTPEQGIGRYEFDATQGPACAIACGAGTIQRNYFVEIDGEIGQEENRQIDCLHDIGQYLGNENENLWRMENGYALPSHHGINRIDQTLSELDERQLEVFRGLLRVGVQRNTQVTLPGCSHLVTQVYASALPVAYSCIESKNWERFARLVLEAAYEATFAVVAENIQSHQAGEASAASLQKPSAHAHNRLFLTYLGGGVFGNQSAWITDAIERACELYRHVPIDVRIVSYRTSNPLIQHIVKRYS